MKINVFILCLLTSLYSGAQLTTNTNQGPAALVQNVLLGPGVQVSNISYSGNGAAIGSFTAPNTNIGIASGIVITTGTVFNNGSGPHGPNNKDKAGIDNGADGSTLISNQVGGAPTYNAATLKFDFIPYSDSVKFKYVFGSEEYPEYVGTTFNDAFGFYISGPGIAGKRNIAQLPNNGGVVSINTVNNGKTNTGPCVNCASYVYNGTGLNAPYNGSSAYIQYDGFTTVLEAVSRVECGERYTLEIVIADVGDAIYDSGIFLEANSLTSKTPIEIDYELSYQNFADPRTMAEECVSATITLSRDRAVNSTKIIPIAVSGTATEGVDYTNVPNDVTFLPGETQKQFVIDAFGDALVEGLETLNLEFQLTDPCGNVTPYIINLNIDELQPVGITAIDTLINCPGDSILLESFPTGGTGPYTYQWSTGETTQNIMVGPMVTTTYTVEVADFCLGETSTTDVTVEVPVYDDIELTVSDDVSRICPYVPETFLAEAIGGTGIYTYQWYDENNTLLSGSPSVTVTPSSTTYYYVIVEDECGSRDSAGVLYTITSTPLITSISNDTLVCPYSPVDLIASATGGWGDYYYLWTHSNETNDSIVITPAETTTYYVQVSDDCQTFFVTDTVKVTIIKPEADFKILSQLVTENLPISFQNLSVGGVSYYWEFGNGESSTKQHPSTAYNEAGFYNVLLVTTNSLGCKDSLVKIIQILKEVYLYIPNAFSPDGNNFNGLFNIESIGVIAIEMEVYNRWGELVFSTDKLRFSWDGTYRDKDCQQGVYVYKLKYTTWYEKNLEKSGTVTLVR
ncbi:MAG: gliding motility-associated-like protein [Lentimonas sp.]